MEAIISDLHGNMEALEAVLKQMCLQGVSKIYCLGDVIGYGPEPVDCLNAARDFALCLRGNHEAALLYHADDFNPQARIALDWTRNRINGSERTRGEKSATWDWIDRLPESAENELFQFVHGSPRDPVREYMLPQDIRNKTKMEEIFGLMARPICFVGHSHLPGVYTEKGRYFSQSDLPDDVFEPDGKKCLINVGSVGQPRDGDPRACYVTWNGSFFQFHRVPYAVERTMQKIMDTKVLPKILAFRLKEGK